MLDNLWQIAANCLMCCEVHADASRSNQEPDNRQWPTEPIMRHLEQLYLSRLRLYHLQFFHSSSSVSCSTYNDNISASHLPENYIMTILKSASDSRPQWKILMQLWSMFGNLNFLPSPKLPTRHYWESLRPSETTPTLPRQHPPWSNKTFQTIPREPSQTTSDLAPRMP